MIIRFPSERFQPVSNRMKTVARWLSVAYLPTKIWSRWPIVFMTFFQFNLDKTMHSIHYIIASNLSQRAYIELSTNTPHTLAYKITNDSHNKKFIIERCLFSIHFVCSYWWNWFNAELYRTVPMCNSINTIPIHIVIVTNVLHFVLSKLSTGIRLKIHGQHAPIYIYRYERKSNKVPNTCCPSLKANFIPQRVCKKKSADSSKIINVWNGIESIVIKY